jgi:hypothetical protein
VLDNDLFTEVLYQFINNKPILVVIYVLKQVLCMDVVGMWLAKGKIVFLGFDGSEKPG